MFTKTKTAQKGTAGAGIVVLGGVLVCVYSLLSVTSVYALARAYTTDDNSIKVGMVVATKVDGNSVQDGLNVVVEKANISHAQLAVGIVIDTKVSDPNDSSINSANPEIVVEDSGRARAYVSDVNGVPRAGDLLAPSPLSGILMRVSPGTTGVVGAMVGNFSGKLAETHTLSNGYKARIAPAIVDMNVHPVVTPSDTTGLQGVVERLIGRPVTELQALVAVALLILTLVIVGGILYGGIANYLMAVGRNPLARPQLRGALYRVVALVAAVLIVSLLACWAVLWL